MAPSIFPFESIPDARLLAFAKHVFCRDATVLDGEELHALCELHDVQRDEAERLLGDIFGLIPTGESWDCATIVDAKQQWMLDHPVQFALVNGREDEGHALKRYKEELERKGIPFDEFYLDQLAIGNDGLQGFPKDATYAAIILTNPELLEPDSAPIFLLKTALIRELERCGRVFPTIDEDLAVRSKLSVLQSIAAAGLPTPRTLVTASIDAGLKFIDSVHGQGTDIVVKPLAKGGGWGVSKIPQGTSKSNVVDLLGKFKWWYGAGAFLLQEFIPNRGNDTRVLVLDGLVIGAETREASSNGESWIYNISKGGLGRAHEVTSSERDLVLAAVNITHQFFSGVDIITGLNGTNYILEINSCPGFKGLEECTGINVAAFVIDYLVFFPR
jgi:RimK family alpha-L-glutamate ligase